MTTGMSAPPIGMTSMTPRTSDSATTAHARSAVVDGSSVPKANQKPTASGIRKRSALMTWRPGSRTGSLLTTFP